MIKLMQEQMKLVEQLRQLQLNVGSQDNVHKQFLDMIMTMVIVIRILDMMEWLMELKLEIFGVDKRLEFAKKEIEEMEKKQEEKPPPPPPPAPLPAGA